MPTALFLILAAEAWRLLYKLLTAGAKYKNTLALMDQVAQAKGVAVTLS